MQHTVAQKMDNIHLLPWIFVCTEIVTQDKFSLVLNVRIICDYAINKPIFIINKAG
jgi:hypothetical protein